MKKRLISLLLILAMLLCMVPSVSAATYSGTCGTGLKWNVDTSTGILRIYGTGAMNDYSQSGAPWYSYRNYITQIVVENGCTHIGNWAFGFLQKVQAASLPNSVTSIGQNAFRTCNKMVSCPLPDYLVSIGEDAFWDCCVMQGLDLPNTLTSIGKRAFLNCEAITTAHIPGGVTTLYYGTFQECPKLATVTLGEGVTILGGGVFQESGLVTLTVPSTVTSIGESCFEDCKSLVSVTMLGCETIGSSAFAACSSLRKVTLAENTKTLGMWCFSYCKALRSIRLPASVETVDYGAFYWHKSSGYPALEQVIVMNPNCALDEHGQIGRPGVCTVYGYENSTAQAYALALGYNFDLIGNEKPEPSIFTDVDPGAFYAKPVEWAVNNKITTGATLTTFAPNSSCTRGQAVAFLWRAAGSPAPKMTTCKFTDVQPGAYYYQAMLWAVENNITTGTSATTFHPHATCTRGQVVTFLWRAMGQKAPQSSSCAFTDVQSNAFYYKAMMWAVENGITNGNTATTFGPNQSCTRGQVVTFLYRAYK